MIIEKIKIPEKLLSHKYTVIRTEFVDEYTKNGDSGILLKLECNNSNHLDHPRVSKIRIYSNWDGEDTNTFVLYD